MLGNTAQPRLWFAIGGLCLNWSTIALPLFGFGIHRGGLGFVMNECQFNLMVMVMMMMMIDCFFCFCFFLQVIHAELESLPWQSFIPSLADAEQLVRITAQFLPEVHSFLVNVWVRCPIAALIGQWKSQQQQQQQQQQPLSVFTRFLACLIHLYVRLAGEPTAQQVLQLIHPHASAVG